MIIFNRWKLVRSGGTSTDVKTKSVKIENKKIKITLSDDSVVEGDVSDLLDNKNIKQGVLDNSNKKIILTLTDDSKVEIDLTSLYDDISDNHDKLTKQGVLDDTNKKIVLTKNDNTTLDIDLNSLYDDISDAGTKKLELKNAKKKITLTRGDDTTLNADLTPIYEDINDNHDALIKQGELERDNKRLKITKNDNSNILVDITSLYDDIGDNHDALIKQGTLDDSNKKITLTKNDNSTLDIDLTAIYDVTSDNHNKIIASATLYNANKKITYKRNDNSVFDTDLADLYNEIDKKINIPTHSQTTKYLKNTPNGLEWGNMTDSNTESVNPYGLGNLSVAVLYKDFSPIGSFSNKKMIYNNNTSQLAPASTRGINSSSFYLWGGTKNIITDGGFNLQDRSFLIGGWVNFESDANSSSSNYIFGSAGTNASRNRMLHIGFRNDNTFTVAFYANDVNFPLPNDLKYSAIKNKWVYIYAYHNVTNHKSILFMNGNKIGEGTHANGNYQDYFNAVGYANRQTRIKGHISYMRVYISNPNQAITNISSAMINRSYNNELQYLKI